MSTLMSYHDARTAALFRELDANPDIILLGGHITNPAAGQPETPVATRYPDRIVGTPIAEFCTMSMGTGAAMAGLRTLVPLGTSSFMFYGWPAVSLEAPNIRYVTGGQLHAPVTFHVQTGLRRGTSTDHQHTPQAMLQNIPGIRIYAPGTPAEVDAVFHAALTGSDPTVIADHKHLSDTEGTVPDAPEDPDIPKLVRSGTDALIVAYSLMVQHSLAAATTLADEGISVAVLSTPLLSPAPVDRILEVAARHEHVVFVDEARGPGSFASYLMARMFEAGLSARVKLVCTLNAPSPFAFHLADEISPTVDRIASAVRAVETSASSDEH